VAEWVERSLLVLTVSESNTACQRDFVKISPCSPARNGYPALFRAGKVKVIGKRSDTPSVTLMLSDRHLIPRKAIG